LLSGQVESGIWLLLLSWTRSPLRSASHTNRAALRTDLDETTLNC